MGLYRLNHKGIGVIRPPFVGFIKNNWLRRFCMVVTIPLMISLVVTFNAMQAVVFVIRRFIYELCAIPKELARFWDKPRTKNDLI